MRFLAITSMKNEGAFVLEWLAHLRTVGFTDLLVFSNDCADGTDAMLDRLQAMGALTHIRQSGPFEEGPQWSALKQADRHPLRKAADWVMFLDVDEFPVIHVGDGTLSALVEALPEADAIPLTWRLFGNNGVVAFEDRPITTQFIRAAPAVMRWPWRAQMFKTLFRSGAGYRKLGVHRPRSLAPDAAPRWFDGSGRELPDLFRANRLFSLLGEENYRLAQLNHYPLGAMESYVVKCDRGRANRAAGAFDMSYWVERNFSTARGSQHRPLRGADGQFAPAIPGRSRACPAPCGGGGMAPDALRGADGRGSLSGAVRAIDADARLRTALGGGRGTHGRAWTPSAGRGRRNNLTLIGSTVR